MASHRPASRAWFVVFPVVLLFAQTCGAYTLTVLSGSGSGTYTAGAVVPIVASAPPTGQSFYRWVGDTAGVANVSAASTTFTMPAADAKIAAWCRDTGAAAYTVYQALEEATSRIYRLGSQPYMNLVDQNGFWQSETIIYHDVETGEELWSLTRELCTDLANIERRPAWSCNGQYISFIGNKVFWNYPQDQLWVRSWAGYNYIANSDGSKRRKLWANGPNGLAMYQDKFNNWDMATPNVLYFPDGDKLARVTLGPANNDRDNTAQDIYTFPNSNSRIIQEMHDSNYMLVEESGSSPNCYVFNLNLPPSDPKFCMSYPLAGEVHPGSFRFRRSDLIVTGGYESLPGGVCLKVDTVNGVLIPWTLPPDQYGEEMWHLWFGPPDDRVCFSGTALGQDFALWVRMPGQAPINVGEVCDGHPTWCGHDPDWAFYSSGTNEGEQPHVDPRYDRHIIAAKADGSQVIVMCKPWDRRRGGTQGYDAIPRPNQSPDATKCWFHSSMLNPSDNYTGSYIGVFRRPYAPTALSYAGGQITFTPHALSYEARCFRAYRDGGTGWQFVQEVPKGQTSFAAAQPGTYMVTAIEWSGLESGVSSPTVTVPGGTAGSPVSGWDTTPPARPANLQVVQEVAGRYRVSWQAPADEDLRYFNVYFSSTEDPQAMQRRLIVSPPGSQTQYIDWTAPLGGSAFYGVTAVDYQGNESQPRYVGRVTHNLTVNSGSGDGTYLEGAVVSISADAAPSGKMFGQWTGDVAGVGDIHAASTTVTMPTADVAVTAAYVDAPVFTLTVNSGAGSGDYHQGASVAISAAIPPSGQAFDKWVGDTAGIADPNDATTTVTMPAGDAEVTAAYGAPPSLSTVLIVNWGGSAGANVFGFADWSNVYLGSYTSYSSAGPAGIVGGWTGANDTVGVNGSGQAFPAGQQVVVTWYNTGASTVTFAPKISFNDPDYYGAGGSGTWYDMPQVNCPSHGTVTTTYTFSAPSAGTYWRVHVCRYTNGSDAMLCDRFDLVTPVPTYLLTVNSGSGSATCHEGDVVAITANPAASGKVFDKWTGDVAWVAATGQSHTTITMQPEDAAITATYVSVVYQLTVNSGTGDGQYPAGTVVDIQADAAPSGMEFIEWTGDVAGVADPSAAATTITMPASAAAVTATYSVVVPLLLGDLNGDGFVGQDDLNIVLSQWGKGAPPHEPIADPRADANHDNFVGQGDLNIVLADWGKGSRP